MKIWGSELLCSATTVAFLGSVIEAGPVQGVRHKLPLTVKPVLEKCSELAVKPIQSCSHLCGCRNCGPFLGPLHRTARISSVPKQGSNSVLTIPAPNGFHIWRLEFYTLQSGTTWQGLLIANWTGFTEFAIILQDTENTRCWVRTLQAGFPNRTREEFPKLVIVKAQALKQRL